MSDFRQSRRDHEPDATEPGKSGLKEKYTSHWDIDYLPRQDMEALMQQRVAGRDRLQHQEQDRSGVRQVDPGRMEPAINQRGAQRAALLLALAALGLLTAGYLILLL